MQDTLSAISPPCSGHLTYPSIYGTCYKGGGACEGLHGIAGHMGEHLQRSLCASQCKVRCLQWSRFAKGADIAPEGSVTNVAWPGHVSQFHNFFGPQFEFLSFVTF